MSRSGYSDECDGIGLWRGAVDKATFGKRGQRLLKDLLVALDAMPEKKLIADDLVADGCYCALGAVGAARGLDLSGVDTTNHKKLGRLFDIAPALAAEIMFENDQDFRWCADEETPEQRWLRIREWVSKQIPADDVDVGGAA